MFGGPQFIGLEVRIIDIARFIFKVSQGNFVRNSFFIDERVFTVNIVCEFDFIARFIRFFFTFLEHPFDHTFPGVGSSFRV